MRKIYLAGLINTKTPRTIEWRENATGVLSSVFQVLDPLRGESNLENNGMTSDINSRGIITRDYQDIKDSDVVMVNLTTYGSTRPLLGTMFELAWCWHWHKPVIAFVEDEKDRWMLEHPFVIEVCGEVFKELSEAMLHAIKRYN